MILVIGEKSGQLGNRLLLFANFINFAINNNDIVLNPCFEEYAEFFNGTANNILCSYPALPLKIKVNQKLRSYYYRLHRYLSEKKIFHEINIQRNKPFNWKNFDKHQELKPNSINLFQGWLFRDGWFIDDIISLKENSYIIREYFKPLSPYQENISNLMSSIRQNTDIVIGVHIRQGDYETHQNGRYFYTSEKYVKVMKSVQNIFPDQKITFLICSNTQQKETYFPDLCYKYGNNHIIEDMYALSECDYIIGPPSSYTMWASFYGNKPLYMIRDIHKSLSIQDFIYFQQWRGIFYDHEDWSKNFWEWTH